MKTLRQPPRAAMAPVPAPVVRRVDVNHPRSLQPGLKALVLRPAPLFGDDFLEAIRAMDAEQSSNYDEEAEIRDAYKSEIRYRRHRHALAEQCNFLQGRLHELEELLVQRDLQAAQRLMMSGGGSRAVSRLDSRRRERERSRTSTPFDRDRPKTGDSQSQRSASASPLPVAPGAVLGGIDDRMGDLQLLFQLHDPLEHRNNAVTKVAARIRGYLARTRLDAYLRSMAEWRWSRCRHVVRVVDKMLKGQSALDLKIIEKQILMGTRLMKKTFGGWQRVAATLFDVRVSLRNKAFKAVVDRRHRDMAKAFLLLYQLTVGANSNKQLARERRLLAVNIRQKMAEVNASKGLPPIVLPDEFKQTFRRHMVVRFAESLRLKSKRKLFASFVANVQHAKWTHYAAGKHWFMHSAGLCFTGWAAWVKVSMEGLDHMPWKASEVSDLRYNPKRVAYFLQTRIMKAAFRPWAEKQKVWREVTLRRRNIVHKFVHSVFTAFAEVTRRLRRLRRETIDTWKGYASLIVAEPFQAWAAHVAVVRNATLEKTHLGMTYRKWKLRQLLYNVVQAWRHQALFGRTDGMYTRQMMAKSLKEQKAFADRVEKLMLAQTDELQQCKELIEREVQKRRDLEESLQRAVEDIHDHDVKVHHTEGEVKRLEGVVDQMAALNPRQVEHIKKLQPTFRFKERTITGMAGPVGSSAAAAAVASPAASTVTSSVGGMEQFNLADVTNINKSSLVASEWPQGSIGGADADADAAATAAAAAVASANGSPTNQNQNRPDVDMSAALVAASQALAQSQQAPSRPQSAVARTNAEASKDPMLTNNPTLASMGLQSTVVPPLTSKEELLLQRAKWLVRRLQRRLEDEPTMSGWIDDTSDLGGRGVLGLGAVGGAGSSSRRDTSTRSSPFSSNSNLRRESSNPRREGSSPGLVRRESSNPTRKESASPGQVKGRRDTRRESQSPMAAGRRESGAQGRKESRAGGRRGLKPRPGDDSVATMEEAVAAAAELRARSILLGSMLIGFVDFLMEGDTALLSAADKRDWTLHILGGVTAEKPAPAVDREQSGTEKSGRGKRAETPTDAAAATPTKDDTAEAAEAAEAAHEEAEGKGKEEDMSPKSWRTALMQLRGMYPGAGNYSGVGVPLDRAELLPHDGNFGIDNGMYARLLDMRHTQEVIMSRKQRHTDALKVAEAAAMATGTKTTISASLFNVYAGNLAKVVDADVDDDHSRSDLLPPALRKLRREDRDNDDGTQVADDVSTDVSVM